MTTLGDSFLPTELIIRIFQLLPALHWPYVRLVCKRWKLIADQTRCCEDSVLRITPKNCVEVLARLKEEPLSMKQRMQDLRLVEMTNSPTLMAIFELAASFIKTLELIESPIYRSMNRCLSNLHELRLSNMPYNPHHADLEAFDLKYFPRLSTLLLNSNLSQQLRIRLLQQLSVSDDLNLQLQHLRLQFSIEEEEHVINVLKKYASTLKALELNYFSHNPLNTRHWERLFQHFSKLQCLQLTGGYRSDWLDAIFVSLPSAATIQYLDLTGSIELEDRTLEFILQRWPMAIKKLILLFCSRITDTSIQHMNQQRNLRVLNLSQCSAITGHGLVQGIACHPNLQMRELYLNGVNNIDEASFLLFTQQLPNLEHLCVGGCTNAITDNTLSKIFEHMTRLRTLELDNCYKLSDVALLGIDGNSIQRLQHLRTLNLSGYRNLTDVGLQQALKLKELRSLMLGYCHKISVNGIEALVHNCPYLEKLTITSCLTIDDQAVWHIATGLKRLRMLNLNNCINLTERSIDYIEQHCDQLVSLLSLSGIDSLNVCDVQQRLLKMNPQLEVVDEKDLVALMPNEDCHK